VWLRQQQLVICGIVRIAFNCVILAKPKRLVVAAKPHVCLTLSISFWFYEISISDLMYFNVLGPYIVLLFKQLAFVLGSSREIDVLHSSYWKVISKMDVWLQSNKMDMLFQSNSLIIVKNG